MLNYNAPTEGRKSSIDQGGNDTQLKSFYHLRKAIIEEQKEQFFMPLSSTEGMPRHHGKTIKVYEYIPLLDDRNVNDQGIDANGVTIANGNLYGSSRDIGTITGKLPMLSENGGRVNRVGFTRRTLEGTFDSFGFFYDFTEDSINFDSDADLRDHLSRELIHGASQISEAILQMQLLSGAGVHVFAGTATSKAEITGEGVHPDDDDGSSPGVVSVMTYKNLMRLDRILTDTRTPKHTKILSGSRYTDTRVIPAARIAFVGPDLSPVLRGMRDLFGDPAFIEVQRYASQTKPLNGEIGSIGNFRIVEVPEMLHWAGAGAAVNDNPGYMETEGRYDVFPMLVVGSESFVNIGFQTNGKSLKFNVITKMPGREMATFNDPYGKTGFSSIQWYQGILIKRPERLGIIYTVAPQ